MEHRYQVSTPRYDQNTFELKNLFNINLMINNISFIWMKNEMKNSFHLFIAVIDVECLSKKFFFGLGGFEWKSHFRSKNVRKSIKISRKRSKNVRKTIRIVRKRSKNVRKAHRIDKKLPKMFEKCSTDPKYFKIDKNWKNSRNVRFLEFQNFKWRKVNKCSSF